MSRILFAIGLGFWRQDLTLCWAGLEIAGNSSASLSFRVLDDRQDYNWSCLCELRGCVLCPLKSLLHSLTWGLVLGVRLFSAHGSTLSRTMKLTKTFACLLSPVYFY